uniref:Uncharacterized protein n=1 Tax=Anguilla anguilla TaxID=7936 RepID=A0A0E9R7J8_ANGAN
MSTKRRMSNLTSHLNIYEILQKYWLYSRKAFAFMITRLGATGNSKCKPDQKP